MVSHYPDTLPWTWQMCVEGVLNLVLHSLGLPYALLQQQTRCQCVST